MEHYIISLHIIIPRPVFLSLTVRNKANPRSGSSIKGVKERKECYTGISSGPRLLKKWKVLNSYTTR